MKVIDCQQGSAQWFAERCGRVTASKVVDTLSFLKRGDKKGGETAARANYKAQIVAEILTGAPIMEGFLTSFMEYGTEQEPFARAAYEVKRDVSVDTVGFVIHPTIDRAGGSPDGLVGPDGGIEIKCCKTSTHIEYAFAGVVPPEYEPQVMFNLACTGREWFDFVSFDGRLPPRHQLFITRLYRDEVRIKEIECGVRVFLQQVDDMIGELNRLNPEEVYAPKPAPDYGELGILDEDIAWIMAKGRG